ncbi:hypothetical protein BpHYR1_053547 [Brachionus plicatilis]|uniref:Uncharacterized protein n=1 Tax=Brachionus plicatilis TaxID=10195 RepID=A0A3M7PIN3_BRAPC|nr:hypothetical protein BpHYR1_053547 [Brachionus plicatilis]
MARLNWFELLNAKVLPKRTGVRLALKDHGLKAIKYDFIFDAFMSDFFTCIISINEHLRNFNKIKASETSKLIINNSKRIPIKI